MRIYHELLTDKWEIAEGITEDAQSLKSRVMDYMEFMAAYIVMDERQVNLLDRDVRLNILTRTQSLLQAFLAFEAAHDRERWENYPYGDIEGGISLSQQLAAEATAEAIVMRDLIFNTLLYDSPLTPDSATEEIHTGEVLVLRNVSQKILSLQGYTVKNLTTSETFTFGANVSLAANATLSLPPAAGITLPDDGAVLVIENPGGTKIDEVRYTGEEALNAPGQDSSLNQIQRQYYSLEAGSERENSYKYGSDLPDEPKAYSYLMMSTRALGDKVY